VPTQSFYNGTKAKDIEGPEKDAHKCGIHHWAEHGIAGRGVLLDYWGYAKQKDIVYGIPVLQHKNCSTPAKEPQTRMTITKSLGQSYKRVAKRKASISAPQLKAETFKLATFSLYVQVSLKRTTPRLQTSAPQLL
jgi:hypothetical protein